MTKNPFIEIVWNLWCTGSVIGIWPRFIEPNLLFHSKINLKIKELPQALWGVKIVHFSDLHFHKKMRQGYLNKVKRKILKAKPDLIVFTGDLVSFAHLEDTERLKAFLSSFKPPLGFFASLGNHDYARYISRNKEGHYDVAEGGYHFLTKVFRKRKIKTPFTTEEAKRVSLHPEIIRLYKEAGIQLMENGCTQIHINGSVLNIVGLGDYWAGKCLPKQAFEHYDKSGPGIVLAHNPDSLRYLHDYPGALILSGHTHGGQVNIPFLSRAFLSLEDKRYKRGLHQANEKFLYVSRGVHGHDPFRWFAAPQITSITLTGERA